MTAASAGPADVSAPADPRDPPGGAGSRGVPTTGAPGPAQGAPAPDARTFWIAAVIVGAVLVLAAMAAVIDRGDDASDPDLGGGFSGAPIDLGALAENGGTIEIDGRQVPVQPIPGCDGGYVLGDDTIVVPDRRACGLTDGTLDLGDLGLNLDFGDLRLLVPGEGTADFLLGLLPDGSIGLFPGGSEGFSGGGLGSGGLGGGGFGAFDGPDPTDAMSDAGDTVPPLSTILLVVAIALLLGAALWWWLRRSAESTTDDEASPTYAREIGVLDRLLWEIDQEPDPRAAILRVYAALETGLGDPVAARRDYETPGVYLRRILGRFEGLDRPLETLVGLFERARFSGHVITEDMRHDAIRALHEVRHRHVVATDRSPATDRPTADAAS